MWRHEAQSSDLQEQCKGRNVGVEVCALRVGEKVAIIGLHLLAKTSSRFSERPFKKTKAEGNNVAQWVKALAAKSNHLHLVTRTQERTDSLQVLLWLPHAHMRRHRCVHKIKEHWKVQNVKWRKIKEDTLSLVSTGSCTKCPLPHRWTFLCVFTPPHGDAHSNNNFIRLMCWKIIMATLWRLKRRLNWRGKTGSKSS